MVVIRTYPLFVRYEHKVKVVKMLEFLSANFALKFEIISTSVCFIRDRANWISSRPEANFKLPAQLHLSKWSQY